MQNQIVQLLVRAGVDEDLAKRSAVALRGMQQETDNLSSSYRRLARDGEKLRSVALVATTAGAAILAPLYAAANSYAQAYKNLEPQANAFNAALQKQKDATNELGRVTATALTPQLTQIAQLEQRIAEFAEAHPDLVKGAINAGGVLIAGGATLAFLGQAQSTINKLATVISDGGVLGAVTSAAISIGSLAAGAKLGEAAVRAYGTATGNAALESFTLSDALKTARQLIGAAILGLATDFVEAKKTWGTLMNIVSTVGDFIKTKFESVMDQLGTGIAKGLLVLQNGLGQFLNGILTTVANVAVKLGQNDLAVSLLGGMDANAVPDQYGQTGYGRQATGMDQGLASREAARNAYLYGTPYSSSSGTSIDRQGVSQLGQAAQGKQDAIDAQYAADKANLAEFAKSIAGFANTGSLGPLVDGILGKIGTAINNFIGAKPTGPGVTTNGVAASPDAVRDFVAFREAQKKADDQYADDSKKLTDDYNASELKAKADLKDKLAQIDQDSADQQIQITQKYHDDEAKAQEQFNLNEQQIQQQQQLRDKQNAQNLRQIAASGDVAAFVDAQQQQRQQKDQDNLAVQQRRQKFDEEDRDRLNQYNKEISDNNDQANKKRQQEQDQFNKEDQQRADNYKKQLEQLDDKHQQEDQLLTQHFAQQIADLSTNIDGLTDLQTKYYADQSKAFSDYLEANKKTLRDAITSAYTFSSGSGAPSGPDTIPAYAGGTPYVKKRHMAWLDEGERVLTKPQNIDYSSGRQGSGDVYNTTINNTVGDIATKSMLDEYQNETVKGVALTFANAKGRGSQ